MSSKLGAHIMSGGNPNPWVNAGSRIFKFTPETLGASAQVPAGALVVGKLDQTDNAINLHDWKHYYRDGWQPRATAQFRFNAQLAVYVGANKPPVNRYTANPRVDAWEMDNEVVCDNSTEAAWLSDYSIEMMRLFDTIGKKYVLFNFAVGTPQLELWPHLLPAVRYARDKGHYVGTHEYFGYEVDYGVGYKQIDANRQPISVWHGRKLPNGQPDEARPYGWAALRYRLIWDTIFKPAGLGDVRLIISELGCDSVESVTPVGKSVGTWKEHVPHWQAEGKDPELTYSGMLKQFDGWIREDSFIVGATIFTVGSVGNWKNWDIAGTRVEGDLLYYLKAINSLPQPPQEPQPPPEPPTNQYKAVVVLLPPTTKPEQAAGVARYRHPMRQTITYSLDDMDRLMPPLNPQARDDSQVIAYNFKDWDEAGKARIRKHNYKAQAFGGRVQPEEPPTAAFKFTHWPTDYRTVTQEFGANPAIYKPLGVPAHEGADIRAPHGTPIYAVADGVVYLKTGDVGAYGIQVRLEHEGGWKTVYAHLDRATVIQSQRVKGGDIIGYADNTGNSSGSHLHLTLKRDGHHYTDKYGVWPGNIHDVTPFLAAFEGVSWPGGSPGIPEPTPPAAQTIDILPFIRANHRAQFDMGYRFSNGETGTQTTQIWHIDANNWLFVKGGGQYERLGLRKWNGQDWIYRFEDTSESDTRFYAHYISEGGMIGAPWFPRFAEVGKWYETTKFVQHYLKAGCVKQNSGRVTDRLRLLDLPRIKTYAESGRTLLSVITLEWGGGEQYDLAEGRGNVGFRDATRNFWFIGDLHGREDRGWKKPACIDLGW